jgi:4a-hydroxytetrahydrobiopterin dehydratase
MTVLTGEQLTNRLAGRMGWKRSGDKIWKDYQFKDFAEALAFVNALGELAERAGHHPDILIHQWNKVRLELTTHDEGGLTKKDFDLAEQIDAL